jgi:hypothetical protein
MNTTVLTKRSAELSPRSKARSAGVFYLLTFLTGGLALVVRGKVGVAAGLIAGACYIAVTLRGLAPFHSSAEVWFHVGLGTVQRSLYPCLCRSIRADRQCRAVEGRGQPTSTHAQDPVGLAARPVLP